MADLSFYGMRATDDWTTDSDIRPKDWRETVLYLYPNGDVPLTALTALMKTERSTDPEFNWWTKGLAAQAGPITNVYTDSNMTTPYVSGGVAADVLYVKVSAETCGHFRAGHQALVRVSTDYTMDVNAKVTAVVKNGADSKITIALLEDDDNSTTTDISDADRILVIGSINAEGAGMPDAIQYDPVKYYNYTQIFRTPLEITRTARKTKLRTYDQYTEAKREALELHGIEMEKAFLWGIMSENSGDNGKPERTTKGLINWIKGATAEGSTVTDYRTDEDFDATTWLAGGEDWLDKWLEVIFRYGSDERMAFVGSGVILAINKLIKNNDNARFEFTPMTGAYGIKVMRWVTAFGTIYMKRHPLFSYEVTNRTSMVIFDPKDIVYKFIDDTRFYAQNEGVSSAGDRIDGTKEEYLTEAGMEFHWPIKCGYLNGFGEANPA